MTYLASLKEDTSDKLSGYKLITNRSALDEVIADNTQINRVIIREDFASEYFTPSGLNKFIEDVKFINKNIIIELDDKSNVATIESFSKRLGSANNIEELIYYMSHYPNEFFDTVMTLTSIENAKQEELLRASSNMSKLQSLVDELKSKISELEYSINVEQINKYQVQTKLNTLIKRINYQYNAGVDPKHMFTLDGNSYDKVLYIKEITRVQFVDTLVYCLKEILKVLYTMPTRLCVIEPYYADGKVGLYPDCRPHYALTERDVISSDILMLGMQPKLMQDILRNTTNISILIILDRGGIKAPHLKGNNVEYVYTVSDLSDIPDNVPKNRIISYSQKTLFIPLIKGFNDLDNSEKITRYSSTKIIKELVRLTEGGR